MTKQPVSPTENWLQAYLVESVRANVCTRLHCTTCGGRDFRRGLAPSLAEACGQRYELPFGRESTLVIARPLAHVHPVPGEPWELEEAVQLILYEIWHTLGEVEAERELEPILEGMWAGEVLSRMKAHYRAREEARRRHNEQNDPERVRQRREEKRRLRQEKHEQRLAIKKERDRISWERHKGNQS